MPGATRVRYISNILNNGTLETKESYMNEEGSLLKGVIDVQTADVTVGKVTGSSFEPIETVKFKSLNEAKKLTKKLLNKHGVAFFDEVRTKRIK